MKTSPVLTAALFAVLALAGPTFAQSPTALTYQGSLMVGGQPANGYFDFRFSLHASASGGGGPVANVIAKPPIAVSNGLFATTLDFGSAGFPGDNRWLEIAVRPTGSRGNYEPLSPRQRITATPYALQAASVADGAVTAGKLSANDGQDGQVLKLSGGQLAWGSAGAGGGVTTVNSGLGLTGGPITDVGTLAIDTGVVPGLNAANAFLNPGNSFVGTFSGNGAGLSNLIVVATPNYNGAAITNLNASNITAGTLSDAHLSANVALRTSHQTFAGSNTFAGVAVLTNGNNTFAGAFSGNGAGLTSLNGVGIQDGTVNSNKLDAATRALLGGTGGSFNVAQSNAYNGSFTGNGIAVTNLNAANMASGVLNDARLSANVALRNAHQTFAGSNTFSGVVVLTNSNNRFVGNGAGLTSLTGTGLQDGTVNSNKLDAATRALLGGTGGSFNVAQSNAYNGSFAGNGIAVTNLSAANIASGALNDARLSANVALRNAHQTFTGSNTFAGVAVLTNSNNRFVGNGAGLTSLTGAGIQDGSVNSNKLDAATRALLGGTGGSFNVAQSNAYNGSFTGNGIAVTNLSAANIASGALNDARLSANVALRNAHQTFTGSNTFSGVVAFTSTTNRFVGTFIGNGGGLTNITASFTNALAGDVTGLPSATTVAGIRGVSVSATAPTANQHLRYNGSAWTPGAVALATDVSGTLPLANGGTAGTSASSARSNLGAAASGANSDITSLTGLTTPLAANAGGSGLSSYTIGDLLYANTGSSLARLADVVAGNALVSGGVGNAPLWAKIGLNSHVSGTLPLANGGTGAGTAAAARSSLGAAASGANADITALTGLTTPLAPSQGGSGQAAYTTGDLLFASAANTLTRRSIGTPGHVLTSSGGVPVWANANTHNHFGQAWTASGTIDGLYVQNNSPANAASGLVGIAGASSTLNYGVFGQSASSEGTGVLGLALASSGSTVGVNGQAASVDGTGVYGVVTATSGAGSGVIGESSSTNGTGVLGQALATTGPAVGVYGYTASVTGYGLYTPNRLYVGNNAFVGGHLTIGAGSRIQADLGTTNAPGVTFFNNQSSGMFSPATNVLGFVTSGNQRIHVAADGKVGIGRVAATNRFEVQGEASKLTAGGWLANSDAAIKREVRELSGALDKLQQVRPVAFRYTPEYLRQHPEIEDKVYYNVIAQEFAQVFPESVKASGEMLAGKAILQVDTYPATIYSIAAVQELHAEVEARERELSELRRQNRRLEARLTAIEQQLAARGN